MRFDPSRRPRVRLAGVETLRGVGDRRTRAAPRAPEAPVRVAAIVRRAVVAATLETHLRAEGCRRHVSPNSSPHPVSRRHLPRPTILALCQAPRGVGEGRVGVLACGVNSPRWGRGVDTTASIIRVGAVGSTRRRRSSALEPCGRHGGADPLRWSRAVDDGVGPPRWGRGVDTMRSRATRSPPRRVPMSSSSGSRGLNASSTAPAATPRSARRRKLSSSPYFATK